MPRAVALLRAINVGGHVVKMPALRAIFEGLGLRGVETFIASGNVLFDAPRTSDARLEQQIAEGLAAALGYEVATFVRRADEMGAIAARRPFGDGADGSCHVAFLHRPPTPAAVAAVHALSNDVDRFVVDGREVHWLARQGMGRATVTGARFEKTVGLPATVRNVTTVGKLATKLAAKSVRA